MKVIVDNKIPYIKESIERIADEVIYLPGDAFTPETIKDADALIIRTRTYCDKNLLKGSKVRFIATATIGFDHIDTDYCREAGIYWTNAPGCNSGSVAQYIHSSLLLLKREKGLQPDTACIGIIGVGNVGRKVHEVARSLGMKILLNDPPREALEGSSSFVDLKTILKECDIITFHTPLNREGAYSTFHLAGNDFFHSLGKSPVIINTSRGEVIDTPALSEALRNGLIREAILDVWENEPIIDRGLLDKTFLGTPHIAGYSADGKANATRMSLESLCRFFGLESKFQILPPAPENNVLQVVNEEDAFLLMYNPENDSKALKTHPESFESLRGNYPFRREKEAYIISKTSDRG